MLVSLGLPPGVYRNGTPHQTKGRWGNCNLVRWYEGTLRPIKGWSLRSGSVTGIARALITWRANDFRRQIVVGTHTGLFAAASSSAAYSDITPVGYVAGEANSTYGSGYGTGLYGAGTYGTPRPDTATITPATVWSLDTWGQNLVGSAGGDDGKCYEWTLDTGTPAAAISGAPTSCRGLVVTEERILFALGASGNPRKVAWSDQEDNTNWTPAATNQAGDFNLQTPGDIVCGRRIKGGTLIFTSVDVHLAFYQGPPFVYGFDRVGTNCGALSPGSVISLDSQVYWMSKAGFWKMDGGTVPLASDVGDHVYSDINLVQAAKIVGYHNSAYGEVWWFYPSASSNENDRYVVYNYRENHWATGTLARSAAVERGTFLNPILLDTSGNIYDHDTGGSWGGATPFAETGDIMPGGGETVMMAREFIPDDATLGEASAIFYGRDRPDSTSTTLQTVTLAGKTDIRFTARIIRYRVVFSDVTARWGAPQIDVVVGGRR